MKTTKWVMGLLGSIITAVLVAYILHYFGPGSTGKLELPSSVIGRSFIIDYTNRPAKEGQHFLNEVGLFFEDNKNMTRTYQGIWMTSFKLIKVKHGDYVFSGEGVYRDKGKAEETVTIAFYDNYEYFKGFIKKRFIGDGSEQTLSIEGKLAGR